jgi:endonuclease G
VFLLVLIALGVFVSRKSERAETVGESGMGGAGSTAVATDGAGEAAGTPSPAVPQPTSVHLFLGNPSEARPDPSLRDNYLLIRSQYALSYNDSKGTANWVSWRLRSSDLGDAPRQRTFLPDTLLPPGFYRVTHQDYTSSGFDRGHLCPHSDRDASEAASAETFLMTNIIPQAPNVNQRSWAMLEVYARELVEGGRNVLFVVAGPHGQGGVGSRGAASTVARGRVVVPETCWKIIVVVPADRASDPSRVSADVRVIAVKVPNRDDITSLQWSEFRTTIADVEQLTGYRFLTNLSPQVAETLRRRLDDRAIPTPNTPSYLR